MWLCVVLSTVCSFLRSGDARCGGRGGHDAHAGLRRGHREADEAGALQPGAAGHGAVRIRHRDADEGGQEAPRRGKLP